MRYTLMMITMMSALWLQAQDSKKQYPVPEFSNEVYFLEKDSMSLVRLEKNSTSLETKTKLGGFGGAEYGYYLEGNKSTTRLQGGSGLSFIFYTGEGRTNSDAADSALRANGIDPASMSYGSMNDPSKTLNLYKAATDKDGRKILLHQGGVGKKKENHKYTFSVRKIREGYYELVIDKTLPKGEYVFTTMAYGSADGSSTSFAFGID